MKYEAFRADENPVDSTLAEELSEFLHKHLDHYGDKAEYIRSCIDYASGKDRPGGLIITVRNSGQEIVGATVICKTGMHGYIPENILVYIAVRGDQRGEGLGGKIMDMVKKQTTGDIALHVEADNPAKRLYEREGFKNPYLEMRWKRDT